MPSDSSKASSDGCIPLCVPEIHGNEWAYVKNCLDTGWVSSVGSYVDRFERMIAEYLGGGFAVATVNGTSALHIALLVAGVRPEEEVLVPALTFIAPANAVRYVGAWPVFIDAEPRCWQMDPNRVQAFLDQQCCWVNGELRNNGTGRRVRAILPVHILGHPCDMEPIVAVARKYRLVVIEDATESLGARYRDRAVGRLGDLACFSFNGNKLITTGGGGMIVTEDESLAERARYFTTQAKDDAVESIHGEIGYNYRLTNIQAAIGCAQMERIVGHVETKRRIAAGYAEALESVPGITRMTEAPWAFSAYWMYTALVNREEYGMTSRDLLRVLEKAGIQTRPLWQPLHLSKPHATGKTWDCPVAERLYCDGISLPCSVGLRPEQQRRVVQVVRSAMRTTSAR